MITTKILRNINEYLEPNVDFKLTTFEKKELSTFYDKSGIIQYINKRSNI